jgi:hypothetical protein
VNGPLGTAPKAIVVTAGGDFKGLGTATRYWVAAPTVADFTLTFDAVPAGSVTFYYLVAE